MRLAPDRVDAHGPARGPSSSPSAGRTPSPSSKLIVSALPCCGHRQPLGHAVDGDHPPGPEHPRAADGELADRPAAPHRDRVARLDLGRSRPPCTRSGRCPTGTPPSRPACRRAPSARWRRPGPPGGTRPARRRTRRSGASTRTARPGPGPSASRPARRSGWWCRSSE